MRETGAHRDVVDGALSVVNLEDITSQFGGVRRTLDQTAQNLRELWAEALEIGDFTIVDRLVEASHAVQRAVIALGSETPIHASHRARVAPERARPW